MGQNDFKWEIFLHSSELGPIAILPWLDLFLQNTGVLSFVLFLIIENIYDLSTHFCPQIYMCSSYDAWSCQESQCKANIGNSAWNTYIIGITVTSVIWGHTEGEKMAQG